MISKRLTLLVLTVVLTTLGTVLIDHLPEFKKSFALSSTGMRDKTMEQILEEIDKCEIVCSNCHRHRTEMRKIEKRINKDKHQ